MTLLSFLDIRFGGGLFLGFLDIFFELGGKLVFPHYMPKSLYRSSIVSNVFMPSPFSLASMDAIVSALGR